MSSYRKRGQDCAGLAFWQFATETEEDEAQYCLDQREKESARPAQQREGCGGGGGGVVG